MELLCLAGGGTDADVAVDLHCVDRRGLTNLCDARRVGENWWLAGRACLLYRLEGEPGRVAG